MNPPALAIHAVVDNPLAKLELARRLLAETRTFDEVKMLRDLGEVARVYARQARLGWRRRTTPPRSARLKLRAERRMGELLAMLPTATGPLRTTGSSSRLPWSFANPTTRADHRYGP
jgi:hypothetical protein